MTNPVLQETVGVTATHPFWSEDRQAFVPAGELTTGERLRTHSGECNRITSLLPRRGPGEVEVNGEHVYFVGKSDYLVHNNGCPVAPKGGSKALETLDTWDQKERLAS